MRSDLGSSMAKNGSINNTPILTSGLANAALVADVQLRIPDDLFKLTSPYIPMYSLGLDLIINILDKTFFI